MSNEIKTLKGLIELVKHSEEYSRINNPDEITGRIIERAVKIGRKQGAVKELNIILEIIRNPNHSTFEDRIKINDYCEKRLKDLGE